jgi:Zn-dependent protease
MEWTPLTSNFKPLVKKPLSNNNKQQHHLVYVIQLLLLIIVATMSSPLLMKLNNSFLMRSKHAISLNRSVALSNLAIRRTTIQPNSSSTNNFHFIVATTISNQQPSISQLYFFSSTRRSSSSSSSSGSSSSSSSSISSSSSSSGNNNRPNGRRGNKKPFKKIKPPRFSFGAGAAAAVSGLTILSKSKGIFAALKLTKFSTLASMLLTVGTYTTFYGFPYAAGMVGLILTHESGHALAMKQLKIPYSPMVFVPFMGAAVAMKESPKNSYDEALIAIAGPVMGTAGSLAVWGAGFACDSQLCYALADFGFMINLFNLMPIGMMDGGRIGNALSPYAGVAGVGIAGSMIALGQVSNPIFYLITMGGAYQTGMRFWNDYKGIVDKSLPRNYYLISNQQKMQIGAGYFGLIGLLFTTMAVNENYKKSPERLAFEQKAQSGILPGADISNVYRDY